MAKRVVDSLWFPEKLGLRLAELRRQKGLTQGQVAELMGRTGKGSKTAVCRLEKGWFRSPSLRLLGDYLRACGAGFENVLDVLHEYTSRPSVPDEQGWVHVQHAIQGLSPRVAGQVVNYDYKTTQARRRAGKLPERPELRVERGLKLARNQELLGKLHDCVARVIAERKLDTGGSTNEILLQGHARKVWGILGRTRGKLAERGRLLAEAEDVFVQQGLVRPEVVQAVDTAVLQFYERAEEPGASSEMPT
jgi:transcriptional regulator with XRE-family HTH domain